MNNKWKVIVAINGRPVLWSNALTMSEAKELIEEIDRAISTRSTFYLNGTLVNSNQVSHTYITSHIPEACE